MNPKKLIGLVGLRRSGKDTAAQALIQDGYVNVKFAGALKHMLWAYLKYVGLAPSEIHSMIEGESKEIPTCYLGGQTTRYAMQTLGTEWGRALISSNLWVDACLDRCKQFEKVVVSDVRFPNEVEALREIGGKIIRIIRPDTSTDIDSHSSEALIKGLSFDCTIVNGGTVEFLHETVRRAVSQL